MKVQIKITREGLRLILATLLVGLASINTGNNLMYLILSVMLSILGLSIFIPYWNLRGITIEIESLEELFVGKTSRTEITLKNKKRFFSAYSIFVLSGQESPEVRGSTIRDLREDSPEFPGILNVTSAPIRLKSYIPLLKSGSTIKKIETIKPLKRGQFRLDEVIVLKTCFPFIFTEVTIRPSLNKTIIVYPQLLPVDIDINSTGGVMGWQSNNQASREDEFQWIRRYHYGDDRRLIHWKATAKSGELMVKEFALQKTERITIILDNFMPPYLQTHGQDLSNIHSSFEKGISFAASVSSMLIEEGYIIRFITSEKTIPFGTGREHFFKILDHLAVLSQTLPSQNILASKLGSLDLIGERIILILQSDLSPFSIFKAHAERIFYATEI